MILKKYNLAEYLTMHLADMTPECDSEVDEKLRELLPLDKGMFDEFAIKYNWKRLRREYSI